MNVPEPLAISLIHAGISLDGSKEKQLVKMGIEILRHYLGEEWAEQNIKPRNDFDAYMRNSLNSTESDRQMYMIRVVKLAASLFDLRDCKNFELLCNRFRTVKRNHASQRRSSPKVL